MPIYEYRCPDCGHQLEKRQSFSAPPLTDCPSCNGHNLKKLVSMTAFALKGDGWFHDHYGLQKRGAEGASVGEGAAAAAPGSGAPAAAPAAPAAAAAPSTSGADAPKAAPKAAGGAD